MITSLFVVVTLLLVATFIFYFKYKKAQQHNRELLTKLSELESELNEKVQDEELFYQSRLAQMGEMISMIAHQWRQPLSAISLTAIGLETKIRLNKFDFLTPQSINDAKEYIFERTELIAQYVNAMTTTIDDFRMFYKKDRQKELSSLDEILERAIKIIGASLDTNNITVKKTSDCCNKKIWVLPNELVQVYLNLLQNAQDQFISNNINNPVISIHCYSDDGKLLIKFCDNAGGIDELVIHKVFRPYFSTKDKQNGTGLGLYMSKTIIEEHHNGTIEVSNYYDEKSHHSGACFTIALPLDPEKNHD